MSSLSSPSLAKIQTVENHPNADRLDIVHVDGCPCIVSRDQFKVGDEVIFIPFDCVLPKEGNFPENLLGRKIKPMRLRGTFSMALALENTWGLTEADNVGEALGITKWEPGVEVEKYDDGNTAPPPPGVCVSKYDLDSLRKYPDLIQEGEEVVITEKIHGANARFVVVDGQLYCGSRSRWLKEEGGGMWWAVAEKYQLHKILKDYPGQVLYGEIFGQVQDLKYGAGEGEYYFRVFDMYDSKVGTYWDYSALDEFCLDEDILHAPQLYQGPWRGASAHAYLAEGKSTIANHVREGFVVRPTAERVDRKHGRVILKLHGQSYLLRKQKDDA